MGDAIEQGLTVTMNIGFSRTFRGGDLVLSLRLGETVNSHLWWYARVLSFHAGFRVLRPPGSACATNSG